MYHTLSWTSDLATKPQSELTGLLTSAIAAQDIPLIKSLLEAKAIVTNLCPGQVVVGCKIIVPDNDAIMKLLSQAAVDQFNANV